MPGGARGRILCRAVTRPSRLAWMLACAAAAGLGACGGEVTVPKQQSSVRKGAELFNERCSGCHTLNVTGARGSKPTNDVGGGERTNGPNFNVRKESREDILYAIRNGGFSGAIMPANIVVGEQAEKVADFLAKYSGKTAAQSSDVMGESEGTGSGSGP